MLSNKGENEFLEKCKKLKLSKAEILNIINIWPSSLVEIDSITEQSDSRFDEEQLQELVDLVLEVLPPHPNQLNTEEATNDNEEGNAGGVQVAEKKNETADGGGSDVVNQETEDDEKNS